MKHIASYICLLTVLIATSFAAESQPATEQARELQLSLGNNLSLKLVLIPAGKFLMGSPDTEPNRFPNEGPQHEVMISKPFYMSIYTVTQEQYEEIMGAGVNPSRFKGATLPVQPMAWEDIAGFCRKLSEKTGQKVRIPTEAEWEYACRAGTRTTWFFGNDMKDGADYGWFMVKEPHPVGQKQPNPWGLYDMYGNVAQICSDLAAQYPKPSLANYTKDPVTDPTGPAEGTHRIARGQGRWIGNCRSAGHRGAFSHTEYADHLYAIRLVVEKQ